MVAEVARSDRIAPTIDGTRSVQSSALREKDAVAVAADDESKTVVLDLVRPLGTVRDGARERWQAWRDEAGRREIATRLVYIGCTTFFLG